MSARPASPLFAHRTPARELLCAAVVRIAAKARERGLTPVSVYLTPADLVRAEIDLTGPQGWHCNGLPLRAITGKGPARLYARGGHAFALGSLVPTPE